jgi:hypothetical protein
MKDEQQVQVDSGYIHEVNVKALRQSISRIMPKSLSSIPMRANLAKTVSERQLDLGLPILQGAGLSLAPIFGLEKLGDLASVIGSGQRISS